MVKKGIFGEKIRGLSAGTGKLCILGNLGIVFIWSLFVLLKLTQSVLQYSQKEIKFGSQRVQTLYVL